MFPTSGLWYESHPAGGQMQDELNAEIEMGFAEEWSRGMRDTRRLVNAG